MVLLKGPKRRRSVGGGEDTKALLAERIRDGVGQCGLVLNNQNAFSHISVLFRFCHRLAL